MIHRVSLFFAAAVVVLGASSVWGLDAFGPSMLSTLRWRSTGPAVAGGRVVAIAVPSQQGEVKTFYIAAAAGGVWKTINAGTTWEPVFDHEGSASIGDVAVAHSNPDIVWVGTGEANNTRSSGWGDGVYKSTNSGKTWTNMGLKGSEHVGRIVIHPTNPDVVYVAALGPLWGPGGERGLFKTTDGGHTWTNTKFISEHTGFTDVSMDPGNPDLLYAAAFQRERRAYDFVGGGPESGLYKTTDGGATWRRLTEGLPKGDIGRIGLSVAASQPGTVYASIDARDGGIFRSDDHGESWSKVNTFNEQPWGYSEIRVDPTNPDRLYVLAGNLAVSEDGGKTLRFDAARTTHVDHHALWINPRDPDYMISGNDGGLYITHDRGKHWDFIDNLSITQFYAIAVDSRESFYNVYGGTQDNSSWGGPSATRSRSGITNGDWFKTIGADGFYAAVDPTDYTVVYAEAQGGRLQRYDLRTGERTGIQPQPKPGAPPFRWNFSTPVIISRHDHKTLYIAANYLFRSSDRGDSWTTLGGDLTRQRDRSKMPLMGKLWGPGAIALHEGVSLYGNIATIDESPLKKGLLYVGTDDGLVQVSKDGGASWTKIERFPGVPEETYVSRVVASHHNEGTVYATFDGHRSNDFRPYVLKSTDYGATWVSISSNLPPNGSVYVMREHPRSSRLLFVGTEFGVFATLNAGESWIPLKQGIPTAPVFDLVIHPSANDLVAGTHGRGIYILDDISPLEGLTPKLQSEPAHVFNPKPALLHNEMQQYGAQADRFYTAPNPPFGATISYYLREDVPAGADARLTISDQSGQVLRTLDVAGQAGLHRVVWNLRMSKAYASPPGVDEEDDEEHDPFFPGASWGPFVLPGQYTARLTIASKQGVLATSEASVVVKPDPLITLSDADYRTLHLARLDAYRLVARMRTVVRAAEESKKRAEEAQKAIRLVNASEPLSGEARAVIEELDDVLKTIRGGRFEPGSIRGRILRAAGQIGSSTTLPTQTQREELSSAAAELDASAERLNKVQTEQLPNLLTMLDRAGVPWTTGRPIR